MRQSGRCPNMLPNAHAALSRGIHDRRGRLIIRVERALCEPVPVQLVTYPQYPEALNATLSQSTKITTRGNQKIDSERYVD